MKRTDKYIGFLCKIAGKPYTEDYDLLRTYAHTLGLTDFPEKEDYHRNSVQGYCRRKGWVTKVDFIACSFLYKGLFKFTIRGCKMECDLNGKRYQSLDACTLYLSINGVEFNARPVSELSDTFQTGLQLFAEKVAARKAMYTPTYQSLTEYFQRFVFKKREEDLPALLRYVKHIVDRIGKEKGLGEHEAALFLYDSYANYLAECGQESREAQYVLGNVRDWWIKFGEGLLAGESYAQWTPLDEEHLEIAQQLGFYPIHHIIPKKQ
jgi:hypothetical protein